MELQAILDAFQANPQLLTDAVPKLVELEPFKKVIDNKSESIFKSRIDEEISKTHSRYDEDMFETLGVRPGSKEDGSKQKTHEKIKELFVDYKKLLEQKDSLTKDAEVQRLMGEVEKLKKEGGGKFIEEQFEQAKQNWTKKEQDYINKLSEVQKGQENYIKTNALMQARTQLKFNPDLDETVINAVIDTQVKNLLEKSKIEGEKVVFLDNENKPLLNNLHEIMSAEDVLKNNPIIQKLLVKAGEPGGGADPGNKQGSIKTITVDGKDSKTLELQVGSFTTKLQFEEMASKALLDSGITKSDPSWNTLKDEAYKRYNVSELPRT